MKKYFLISLTIILSSIISLTTTINAHAIEEYNITEGKSMYIKTEHLGQDFISSPSNDQVLKTNKGLLFGRKVGTSNVIFTNGANQEVFKINVTEPESVKWLYPVPNNPKQGDKVTLVAIANRATQKLEFIINEHGNKKTVEPCEKIDDGKNLIYKAHTSFADSGQIEITANTLMSSVIGPKRFSHKTNIFVSKSDSTNLSPQEFRASDKCIEFISKKEGFSSSLKEDPLSKKTYDIGFGLVILPRHQFYNNINRQEAYAKLVNIINNGFYTKAVNSFLLKNNIIANQQQFDALLSLTYNIGSRWTINSNLSKVFLSNESEDIGAVNSTNGLRLRTQPNLNAACIRTLLFGEEVSLLEPYDINKDWLQVSTQNGETGFCYREFISLKGKRIKGTSDLNSIDRNKLIKEFLKYHHAGNKRCIKGLLNRRIEELQIFLYKDYSNDGYQNKYKFPLPSCYINSLGK